MYTCDKVKNEKPKKKAPTMDSEIFGQSLQILPSFNEQNLLKMKCKHELDSQNTILLMDTNSAKY